MASETIAVGNILVAVDFGGASNAALAYGASLARTLGATLHLVHVVKSDHVDTTHERARLAVAVEPFADVQARIAVLRSDNAASALIGYAGDEHIDLIVAGAEGRIGVRGFLDFYMGSVAQNLVRNAPCPVMTMRGPAAAAA